MGSDKSVKDPFILHLPLSLFLPGFFSITLLLLSEVVIVRFIRAEFKLLRTANYFYSSIFSFTFPVAYQDTWHWTCQSSNRRRRRWWRRWDWWNAPRLLLFLACAQFGLCAPPLCWKLIIFVLLLDISFRDSNMLWHPLEKFVVCHGWIPSHECFQK